MIYKKNILENYMHKNPHKPAKTSSVMEVLLHI
jgi:hypothetical protein